MWRENRRDMQWFFLVPTHALPLERMNRPNELLEQELPKHHIKMSDSFLKCANVFNCSCPHVCH